MGEINKHSVRPTDATPVAVQLRRVRFTPHPITGTRVRRAFKQPRACLAVEQTIPFAECMSAPERVRAADTLDIVVVTPESRSEWERIGSDWLRSSPDPEAVQAVAVTLDDARIQWLPGRAVVEAKTNLAEDIINGLIEFAFHEGEVRALEREVEKYETQARADAPLTVKIEGKDRRHWPRFRRICEDLIQLRISFASLEPRVERGSRYLSKLSRSAAARLYRSAAARARMEGLDGRLEVCEDLYDGVIDRIADYHGWHTGHVLEVIIIFLLLIEAGLMLADLLLRAA